MTAVWDEETAQNFAQFEADGATYQIWLEDMQSISAKLNLMSGYNLAGVAAWKLGLEKAEIWDAIEAYLSTVQMAGQTVEQEVPQVEIIETD